MKYIDKTVIELFAGVGGFRVGLNNIKMFDINGRAVEKENFDFVWANQWEPSTRQQHAFDCYNKRFSSGHNVNEDINLINKEDIPDHSLLCAGFPCQDYSVARTLSEGIEGKKGVLWWQIVEVLKTKKPPFVLLENVDRLLISPSKQRGRDFGIILRCFADMNYSVEWRVVNAADYGFPQRRKRVYIFAYHNSTKYAANQQYTLEDIVMTDGLFAKSFPVDSIVDTFKHTIIRRYSDLAELSNDFTFGFENYGLMWKGHIFTAKITSKIENPTTLGEIVVDNADEQYYLSSEEEEKIAYLRGSKKIPRTGKDGFTYYYSEGAMSPTDDLSLPGRTMLTSEGSISRTSHVIRDPLNNRIRFLTPIECERMNMFPDDWTNTGMSDNKRYFMMGNALVCGVIDRLGEHIKAIIDKE